MLILFDRHTAFKRLLTHGRALKAKQEELMLDLCVSDSRRIGWRLPSSLSDLPSSVPWPKVSLIDRLDKKYTKILLNSA